MQFRNTLRRVGIALMLLVAFLVQGTWALAGTTGGLNGVVLDEKNQPVAQAAVTAASPSGSSTSTTDAQGHYLFLQLAPDTYTVSVIKKGYQAVTQAGVTVFADNNSTADLHTSTLTEIASVTSKVGGALVKSGVTADTYSINSQTIQKSAAFGGGGNLDNAYSAMAAVPGVTIAPGGSGWNQPVFVRGSQFFFTGFEFDGVPVNRAFDNYNASTESTLGLQELQVYTGGGPAGSSSSGTSGFINQVIKTGTYPGYGSFQFGLGTPAYYHQGKAEFGGASPDRNFSYYGGISGYNQGYRIIDSGNGASQMQPGMPYQGYTFTGVTTANGQGVVPLCDTAASPTNAGKQPVGFTTPVAAAGESAGCFNQFAGSYGTTATISDREDVANFHIKIPRKSGQKDDIQLLMSASSLTTMPYTSLNDCGGIAQCTLAATGTPYCSQNLVDAFGKACAAANYPSYTDARVYNQPFGTSVTGVSPQTYFSPNTDSNRAFNAALPATLRDPLWNDTGIFKAQYTHPFSDRAYARLFGYTFFSDWQLTGPVCQWSTYVNALNVCPGAANYNLITHTSGGELQIADQINNANLLNLTANYTTASVNRFNNSGFIAGASPIGVIGTDAAGQYHCYDKAAGTEVSCAANNGAGLNTAFRTSAKNGIPGPAAPACTSTAGAPVACTFATLWDGSAKGTFNKVKPKFTYLSLTDQYRPSEKLLFNIGLRYERYQYDLPASDTAGANFYSQIFANQACFNPTTGVLALKPLNPGQPPPQGIQYTTAPGAKCADPLAAGGLALAGFYHLNGDPGNPAGTPVFSDKSPSAYAQGFLSARLSGTYTLSPDSVVRFSAGRFVQPPISASVQYQNRAGDARSIYGSSVGLGFFSPYHPIPAQSAAQYDASLERHIKGTDMSFKISPFYNFTHGYQQQSFIGQLFVTQVPVGNFRSQGVEFAFNKGDFNKNGLSGQVALTYTNAKVQYTNWFGQNQITNLNKVITAYNSLADPALGASPCYAPNGGGTAAAIAPQACGGTAIVNPYYGKVASLLDPNAWYSPASNVLAPGLNSGAGNFDSPWVASALLNWRHDRLAITPTLQYLTGTTYGNTLDFVGLDPRICGQNQLTAGITAVSPTTPAGNCDYLSLGGLSAQTAGTPYGILYVPDPARADHQFTGLGQYRNPSILTGNMAISYELSKKVTAQLTLTNIFHSCFGGTKGSWTNAYPVSQSVCGYGQNGFYTANFYNGTSALDAAANGVAAPAFERPAYGPNVGLLPQPFNAYLQFTVKI
ncbi:MAG: Plug and carboxypeptidase regulatory-like domain-containing protein [Candidatus Eremiobacteraeota bacterium]|nr:Plug and carboxypeptidase regulatory-like domain-containing protein [Candidatus Eremiobacteraeota bacterium]